MSTRATHTPGLWMIEEVQTTDPLGNDMAYYVQEARAGDDYEVVAIVPNDNVTGDPVANARLIAAAPEMLALLEFARDSLAHDNGITWLKEQARALIARIDGAA